MSSVNSNRRAEIDANYAAFTAKLGEYMAGHAGEWALMKGGKLVDFFPSLRAAREKGEAYPDKMFSIQKVTDKTIDEGYFDNATHHKT